MKLETVYANPMSLAKESEFYPESRGCIELFEREPRPDQHAVTSCAG